MLQKSAKDLAARAGLHYTTAQRFCSGAQENASLTILSKVCKSLQVQPGDSLACENHR